MNIKTLRTWLIWALLLSISPAVFAGIYLVEVGVRVEKSIVIAWDPSLDPSVAGYNLYVGTVSGSYANQLNVTNLTSVTLAGFLPGTTYYFTVTAYGAIGNESQPSNEIRYEAPVGPSSELTAALTVVAQKVQFSFQGAVGVLYQIEATEDLQHWTTVLTTNFIANGPITLTLKDSKPYAKRFFRIAQFPQVYLVAAGISVDKSLAIAWDPSPDPNIVGYNVYVGMAAVGCINKLNVTNLTSVTLAGFLPGNTYSFTVRGYDASGNESLPVKEIIYEAPGAPSSALNAALTVVDQKTVRFNFQGAVGVLYQIEATEDFQHWTTVLTTNFIANGPITLTLKDSKTYAKRFFRIAQFPQVHLVKTALTVVDQKAIRLSFQGAVGALYQIEATEDLRNWTTVLTTNFVANGPITLTLKDPGTYAKRFFRISKFSQN